MTRDYSFWITYMKISDQFLHRLSFFQSSYQFVAFFFLQSFRQFTLYCTLGNLFTSHNQPTSAHESREYCVPILFTTETATRRRRRGRRRRWNWRKSNRIETFRVPPSLRVQVKLSFQFRHARRRCCWSEKILWGILQTKMCEATTWISGVCQEDPRWWVWPQTLHWAIFWLLALCWQMCKCVSAVFLYTPKVSRN